MNFINTAKGVSILAPIRPEYQDILSLPVQEFVASLHRSFNARRKELLNNRVLRQQQLDAGMLPDFLPETKWIRDDPTWQAAKPAPGLIDRRVEITGPVDRKMVINALNSGALTFMADFEDSNSPTWENNIAGQVNLRDANLRTISFARPQKHYKLNPTVATLIVRPRGWHLVEKHFLVDNEPISASIFDFGVYFFNNAKQTIKIGAGPYFYLPKMESHLEARLWNDIFNLSQDILQIPRGTIRATVLIETIMASFEMDEILFELKDHSSGLNCGRWDYIFSFIKRFRNYADKVLPDRSSVSMTTPFMDAYVKLLIKTCHKRGVHAMGGMAAQIPIKDDEKRNHIAMDKVKNDKLREVTAGHDGTWVAHPALVQIAKKVFDEHMPQPNQLYRRYDTLEITAKDLTSTVGIPIVITENGVRNNINVALQYMEAWLRGNGCVPIHDLMEDAATAEISRSQLWQWVKHGAVMNDGKKITKDGMIKWVDEEVAKIKAEKRNMYSSMKFEEAKKYLLETVLGGDYAEFLTTLCYDSIITISGQAKL